MFKESYNNKRYYTLDYFYKKKYGSKVFKVSLNAGFSCPNKDGSLSSEGCIYCSKTGSGENGGNINEDLLTQFENIKNIMSKKWPNSKQIAYFQANTNTYGTVDELKSKYEQFLNIEDVVGINISTRSDCISDDVLDYLEELNSKTDLTIELGLQSIHEKTTTLINRCHSLDNFTSMVKKLRDRNIDVVVHIINGLPFESEEMMLETAKYLNDLDINGIKIHMLHIIKDTKLHQLYNETKFHILSKEEYANIVCKQIEVLKDNIVINRVTSDPVIEDLIEPTWLVKKFQVLNEVDKILAKNDSYQGKFYKEK